MSMICCFCSSTLTCGSTGVPTGASTGASTTVLVVFLVTLGAGVSTGPPKS